MDRNVGGGFSVCNPSEDYRNLKFVHYSTTDGLVNNMVESIIEDKTGKYGLPLSMVYLVFHLIRKLFEKFLLFSFYARKCI